MDREGFVFYRSFWDAVQDIDDEHTRLLAIESILRYGLTGEEQELPRGPASMVFKMARPQLEANYERFINGSKGGRPKKPMVSENKNHRLLQEKTNGSQTEKPKEKEKEKVKVKEKEKVKEIPRTLGTFENVHLTTEQEEKLVGKYGEQQTGKYIERLSGYMANHDTNYKDHYRVLISWMQQDGVPEAGAGSQSDIYTRALEQLERRVSV